MQLLCTTELDAVNTLLKAIKETRINSLEDIELTEAEDALSMLRRVALAVQTGTPQGSFQFNKEFKFLLVRNSSQELVVPTDVIKISPSDRWMDIVQKGNRLYDRKLHSFTFTHDVKVDITWNLAWEDLPEAARSYITIAASRLFSAEELSSDTNTTYTEKHEAEALQILKHYDTDVTNPNWFDDEDMQYIINRR